ncbi:MAG: phosphopentomutase [Bdellovibrionia bacterium]
MATQTKSPIDRVILIVLDGVGAGELPDAKSYGDTGSNTLGNLARVYRQKTGKTLQLPNLASWGIGNITQMEGVSPAQKGEGAFGRAVEKSRGKDTTSGHWEMAGLVINTAFATFPDGFPQDVIDRWCRENNLPGVLGNKSASGTEIIEELGEEHMRTGKPILYTSADSVWQVAAHEESFGLDRLLKICKSAREICDELKIGRVIARPFIGDKAKGIPFKRTYNRKDYAQLPPSATFLDQLRLEGVSTLGIGKISNIYAGQGISENIDTKGNTDGIRVLIEQLQTRKNGLIFCNLIDFDMLYGHRRDVEGFAMAMEEFDRAIPEIKKHLTPRDLVLISADHGNDPTFPGTDHTREYIPILAYSPAQKGTGPVDLGIRTSFADIGATTVHALLGQAPQGAHGLAGTSFLKELGLAQAQ